MNSIKSSAFGLAALCILAGSTTAQYAERSRLVGSTGTNIGVDASGRSLKTDRLRSVHTPDDLHVGGTAQIIHQDPFLAYQFGREINFREYRNRDGVLGKGALTASSLGGLMPDETTAEATMANQVSCLGCHNIPYGNPGGNTQAAKDSGFGRQVPHYFGAGLVEMIGLQTRTKLLLQIDTDSNGWIDATEAQAAPASLTVVPAPGADPIDFGDPRLDGGATGSPSFDNVVSVWYVDASGQSVEGATQVDGVETFGYRFALSVFGWGEGLGRGALGATTRGVLMRELDTHMGMQAYDPSTNLDPDGDGVSEPTLAGAIQFPALRKSPDEGVHLHANGYSLDDPDGDEYLNEISEGDLDFGEWFMLHTPRPTFRGTPAEYADGLALMDAVGCTQCHVADWKLEAADATFDGDRRAFDYSVAWNDVTGRLEGTLTPLYTLVGQDLVPDRGEFTVAGIFTDFRHHDLGAEDHEMGFDGVMTTVFRTAPLWGVGSGFPWAHDGESLSLREMILRHGGEGDASRQSFLSMSSGDQRALLDFLASLQLFDVESTPADIDGDSIIQTDYVVQGLDTGYERFNAEWLFDTPLRIQGDVVNAFGVIVTSLSGKNLRDAYRTANEYRKDKDGDGWPDVWDPNDDVAGFKNGKK
ncbi:MAG: hypothetical protein H6825_13700 [Planctomycetes bacterium]|nr:hypothetical protein [Planctomycetota bacterium]